MRRAAFVLSALLLGLGAACRFEPSAEDKAKIDVLQRELKAVKADVTAAEQKNAALGGGLTKALVEVRLEILKTTEALIQQRIQALESGARITTSVAGGQADPKLAQSLETEIVRLERELKAAQDDATRYAGGLVGAMKQATVATQEQSLAMVKNRYLAAKYGLPVAGPSPTKSAAVPSSDLKPTGEADSDDLAKNIVTVQLLRKRYAEQDYQNFIWIDIEFTAKGLDKPARAIKGVLHLQDLFGESKMNLNWSIDKPLAPGESVTEKGSGFKYNQFMSEHQWVRATELNNMTASFTVQSILYADGTRTEP